MLYNHGWKKQQTQRPKGSGPKRVRQAKKPTNRNPAMSQKDHFKSIWLYISEKKFTWQLPKSPN